MNSPIYLEWAATQPPRETRPARHGRPVIVLAGIVAVLAASVMIWREFEPLLTFRPVGATIVRSDIARVQAGSRPGSVRSLGARRMRAGFEPDIDYRYTVDGQEWFGAYFRRSAMLEPRAELKRRLANWAPGQAVTAWYNPWQPEDAVLDRGPNRVSIAIYAVIALLGALLVGVGSPPRELGSSATESAEAIPLRKSA